MVYSILIFIHRYLIYKRIKKIYKHLDCIFPRLPIDFYEDQVIVNIVIIKKEKKKLHLAYSLGISYEEGRLFNKDKIAKILLLEKLKTEKTDIIRRMFTTPYIKEFITLQ